MAVLLVKAEMVFAGGGRDRQRGWSGFALHGFQ
jgi:hypothetical protein